MNRKAAFAISGAMTLAIFAVDSFMPLGFSTWLLYAIPLLIVSSMAKKPSTVLLTVSGITLLIVVDLLVSPPGIKPYISLVNRTFGISALWALSFLNLRRKRNEDEIRRQASMLNAANRALAESEANMRTIFDSTHDGILIHDLDGRIIDVNRKMLEMYKVGYEQALSLSISEDYSTSEDPLDALPDIWRQVTAGKELLFEWKCRRPGDGSTFEGEVFLRKIRLKDRDVVLANVKDITERKAAQRDLELRVRERTKELAASNSELRLQMAEREKSEATLKRSKDLSDALNRINSIINSTLDPDEIMKKVVVEAATAIGCESSALDSVQNGVWTIRYIWRFPEETVGRTFTGEDVPFADMALRTKKPVVINDAFNDPRARREIQQEYGVRSVMTIPLIVRESGFGVLFFNYHSRVADFTDEQIDFSNKLSLSVSLALENANLYDAVRKAEGQLRHSEETLRLAIVTTRMGTFDYYPQTGELQWSDFAKEHFGLPPDADPDYETFISGIHPDDRDRVEGLLRNVSLKDHCRQFLVECRTKAIKDGQERWISAHWRLFFDKKGHPLRYVGTTLDITGRKRMQEEIQHMAQHDALTGLPNRRLFREVANVELAQAHRHGTKLAIFFLDLDRFKEINDTFGHEVGDQLLKEAASRIRSAVRTSDTVARIGGDEFNVIISDIEKAEYAGEVAVKILKEVRKPFRIDGNELNVSTSLGISVYPDDGQEIDTLLRYADIAMYYAKAHGRNTFQFYNPVINTSSLERIEFENRLRRAIERGELRLYFQPLVNVGTGKMVSVEILVRWQHPEQGLLLPAQFLKTADDIGLLPDIDAWVLKAASGQIKTWLKEGIHPLCITVNLSARQFQSPDLTARISRILEETGLPPECLDIEITETAAMDNIENTIAQLRELTAMGIHISIDDFGTGYSSLSYLKKLPIDRIKIDQSFIRTLPGTPTTGPSSVRSRPWPARWGSGPLPKASRRRSSFPSCAIPGATSFRDSCSAGR